MARIRDSILHWGDKYDGPDTYKDGRRGGLSDAFWDEDELVDFPRPSRRKKRVRKTRPGCPGNNNKRHIYVYTTEFNSDRDLFFRYFGFYKWEKRVCCGCTVRGGSRLSERYTKKFKTYSRWSSAEMRNEGYAQYRRDYIAKYGYTEAVTGGWW